MKEIEDFFKAYYSEMKGLYLEFDADQYGLTEENYWEKVLKPSAITDKDFEPIEQKPGITLPASFKAFYQSHYSLEPTMDTGGLFIAGNTEEGKLVGLYDYLFNDDLADDITALGLVPFGLYNDEWYVCLDMNKDQEDPQIVLFEMSNWDAGKEAISHRPWFSNFLSFLRCITNYQINGHWDNFDALDPGNHYLTAYDYWKKFATGR